MKLKPSAAVLLGFWIFAGCAAAQPTAAPPAANAEGGATSIKVPGPLAGWVSDPDEGLARAASEKRPVLLFFSSKTIPPAKAMKIQVLPSARAREAAEPFIRVDADVDAFPEFAGKYKVNQLPVFVVLDPSGNEMDRFSGFMPPAVFADTLRDAADPAQTKARLQARIDANPDDREARWLLARKAARDKDRVELDKQLIEMRESDPDNANGFLDNVAFLEMMTSLNPKLPEEGVKKAEQFLGEFPNSEFGDQADFTRSQMAYQMGDTDKALDILRAFPQKHPDSPLAEQVARDLGTLEQTIRQTPPADQSNSTMESSPSR